MEATFLSAWEKMIDGNNKIIKAKKRIEDLCIAKSPIMFVKKIWSKLNRQNEKINTFRISYTLQNTPKCFHVASLPENYQSCR